MGAVCAAKSSGWPVVTASAPDELESVARYTSQSVAYAGTSGHPVPPALDRREALQEIDVPDYWSSKMPPDPMRHGSGSVGSHAFLAAELVNAFLDDREPAIDVSEIPRDDRAGGSWLTTHRCATESSSPCRASSGRPDQFRLQLTICCGPTGEQGQRVARQPGRLPCDHQHFPRMST